ncbi:hypothetical protein AKG34_08945 [Peribacillus butanolivorans]|uniref:hypothetical protein n=1 Tax=Peribacillus butanolivorans TaxID=421767 RepID=UPI0006A73E17|nr:hypothetical protein [Peribacillus butanolivorans]KON68899.1 hypothetical protein AKG34_08945 [Peribacillus butanolivorans]KRF67267.1 hypothetical protein ASG99_16760 [Bacillus sp. Soil768D1]
MDILLRNIDPVAMKKIDEMAKRKSISRQEFLKSIVEKVAYEPEINENEFRLESIIKMNFQIMKEATITINRFENLLVELTEE